ncbi:MAG TPA: RelA/SpoT domain-containing protein [Pseudonocardiaceae bacterium]|jgi:ppGpp synthetase/RelA/SpoT-type nucleotidyltranferase|nr:RelA/SpoT domain-containing protein [Pseudonocardiaceae bacterium]
MNQPISANQLKNLTGRLRAGTETPADLHALADLRMFYKEVLDRAHEEVVGLCTGHPYVQPMAPRVKTMKTTLEKLLRQPHLLSIAQIRDYAGLRVVVHGTRTEQNGIATKIAALFRNKDRPPKWIDRRVEPRSGYRAVHLEVRREGILIEVQIRTALQHRWAELFERAADKLGRGLRYGEPVPDLSISGGELVDRLNLLSEEIDNTERLPHLPESSTAQRTIARSLDSLLNYIEELK